MDNMTTYTYTGAQAPPAKTWKQNPMIPAAVLGGGVALALAVILGGNKSKTISQRAMEARVLVQGTAVAGLFAAGMYGLTTSQARNERQHQH
jgi:apolipoprotein N-acyltransferase